MSTHEVRRQTVIECDQCGRTWATFQRPRKARRRVSKLGWVLGRGQVADLCRLCAWPVAAAVSGTREDGQE